MTFEELKKKSPQLDICASCARNKGVAKINLFGLDCKYNCGGALETVTTGDGVVVVTKCEDYRKIRTARKGD